jgi:glucan biosynthesis protein C
VLLCVGYFVVQWAIPAAVKFVVIDAISFAIIMALYEFVVRRFNVIRFLFGMELLKQATPLIARPIQSVPEKT